MQLLWQWAMSCCSERSCISDLPTAEIVCHDPLRHRGVPRAHGEVSCVRDLAADETNSPSTTLRPASPLISMAQRLRKRPLRPPRSCQTPLLRLAVALSRPVFSSHLPPDDGFATGSCCHLLPLVYQYVRVRLPEVFALIFCAPIDELTPPLRCTPPKRTDTGLPSTIRLAVTGDGGMPPP